MQLNEEDIFSEACEIDDPDARANFLNRVCGQDEAIRQRVERLIQVLPRADFMEVTTGDGPVQEYSSFRNLIGSTIGPYKIREQIGEGGMGAVYVAQQESPVCRKVALKIIKPGMATKDVVARFEAERQALAMMDHPSIARVFDGGATEAGQPYFVMELVHGLPITEFCDSHKLANRERVEIFVSVCKAVEHAHKRGIIHRDLKPSNVMVSEIDGKPVAKVIDFGVAKAMSQRLTEKTVYTQFSQMIGTPLYMSPEQASMGVVDVDTRTDVYSLGVMLYELLTGDTPFDRQRLKDIGFDEMRRVIRQEEPKRPSAMISTLKAERLSTVSNSRCINPKSLRRSLCGELDWIVMKALEKDRERRYESTQAFGDDLKRYLDGEAVHACPPSLGYRVQKLAYRNKSAFVTSALITLTVILGLIGSITQAVRATTAEEIAESRLANETLAKGKERQAREAAEASGELAEQAAADAYRQQYQAQMQLGNVDLATGNLTRLYQTLISHLPEPGRIDRRGWEWYYLFSRSQEARELFDHYANVDSMAWSPDGQFLATVSQDGQAIVWDIRAGRISRRFGFGGTLKRGVSWSPNGQRLAWGSVGDENAVRIWDSRTDEVRVLYGHTHSLRSCAWSPDGTKLATSSLDETARIWEVETGECAHVLGGHRNHVNVALWLADGESLITAGHGGLKLWDAESGEQLREEMTQYRFTTADICDATTSTLILGTDLGMCLLVDLTTWNVISELGAHASGVGVVAVSPDGKSFASGGSEGAILWNLADGKKIETLRSHRGPVSALAWHPAGNQIAVGHADGGVELWDYPMPTQPLTIQGANEAIQSLMWSEDDLKLTAETVNGWANYEAPTGKSIHRELVDPDVRLATSPDGSFYLVAEHKDEALQIVIRESVHKEIVCELKQTLISPESWPTFVWSRDGRRIASYERKNFIVWEVPAGQRVFSWSGPALKSLAWASDCRRLAIAGGGDFTDNGLQQYMSFVHVFDIDNKRRLLKVPFGSARVVATRVAWQSSGTAIAAGNGHGSVGIWDAESGRELSAAQPHVAAVQSLDWMPDGGRIASLGNDGTVKILDPWSGEETLSLASDGGALTTLKWSSDGSRLAVGNAEGQISIWDASKAYAVGENSTYSKTLAGMHSVRARQNLKRRDWEGALREISRAIDLAPGSPAHRTSRGFIHVRLGNMELALADLNAACDLAPDDKRPLFHRLELYGVLERWTDALVDAARLVELEQTSYARYRLAMIHLILGHTEAFRKICQETSSMDRIAVSAGFYAPRILALTPDCKDDCERLVSMLREHFGMPSGQDAAVLGALLYRAGHIDEAIEHLMNANHGWEQTGSISATARSYGDVLPGDTWYFLAMACHDLGRYQEAQSWYEKAEAYTQATLVKPEVPRDVLWPVYWEQRISLQWRQREARARLGISMAGTAN